MSKEYIDNLIKNNFINVLTEHRNFNPRIISVITREEELWKKIEPSQFFNEFNQYLDYPNLDKPEPKR